MTVKSAAVLLVGAAAFLFTIYASPTISRGRFRSRTE